MTEFSRRAALALLAAGAASACAIPDARVAEIAGACARPAAGDLFRVDMHCHLLNHRDAQAASFLNRRFVHGADVNLAVDIAAGLVIRIGEAIASLSTHLAEAETRFLSGMALPMDPAAARAEFCAQVARNQRGLFLSRQGDGAAVPYGEGRLSGFFSMRARNAAMMMHLWPEVDLFTPSMVDFYESPLGLTPEDTFVETQEDQVAFYRALALATRGRFLPLVSFHPLREHRGKGAENSPLALVKKAITEHGFVGVKLHPSSGFDPLDNAEYGAPNQPLRQGGCRLDEGDAQGMDDALARLYDTCATLDVPILTHNADSLFVNAACMRRGDEPDAWTNSAAHWVEVARRHDIRVCLGHFAGGFVDQLNERPRLFGPPERRRVVFENGELRPSHWLRAAMQGVEGDAARRIWLDIADMSELVRSAAWHAQPELRGERSMRALVDRPRDGPEAREDKRALRDFAPAFTRFLKAHPALAGRVMYGSDWHMPDASRAGPQYLPLMEGLMPEPARAGAMGLHAAEFFGLAPGRRTRKRLEAFYDRNGIAPEQIPWMARLDAAIEGVQA